MSTTEEREFKEMLNKLRQTTKVSQFELELRDENTQLERELQQYKSDLAYTRRAMSEEIKKRVNLEFDIEKFMKREAISFMRIFKEKCEDKELTDEMQAFINHFMYKMIHSVYLSSKN